MEALASHTIKRMETSPYFPGIVQARGLDRQLSVEKTWIASGKMQTSRMLKRSHMNSKPKSKLAPVQNLFNHSHGFPRLQNKSNAQTLGG